jgi:HSP20 family molecular chaperone IbpA
MQHEVCDECDECYCLNKYPPRKEYYPVVQKVEVVHTSSTEDEKSCSFQIALPSFLKEEISVSLDGKKLTVTAEQKDVGSRLKMKKVKHEFKLSSSVSDVEATLELGVLSLMCKKVNTKLVFPVK